MNPTLREVVGGSLTLNREAFAALVQSEHPILISTTLLVLIGLSWMLGHCAVLFLNRVPPRRFILRTFALAGSFILGALMWVGSAWLIASILPGNRQVPLWIVIPLTAFAYAPLVLSALIIIPYVGSGIEAVLNTWTLLALIVGMSTAFEIGLVSALLCAGVGWLLTRFIPRLAGGRLNLVFNNAWYRVNSGQVRTEMEAAAAESVGRMRGS
jgi:hypothetical protein